MMSHLGSLSPKFRNIPDDNAEVLKMCLATPSVGDYKPVSPTMSMIESSSRIITTKSQ